MEETRFVDFNKEDKFLSFLDIDLVERGGEEEREDAARGRSNRDQASEGRGHGEGVEYFCFEAVSVAAEAIGIL